MDLVLNIKYIGHWAYSILQTDYTQISHIKFLNYLFHSGFLIILQMPLFIQRLAYSDIYWEERRVWDNVICQNNWDNDRILPKHTCHFLWFL